MPRDSAIVAIDLNLEKNESSMLGYVIIKIDFIEQKDFVIVVIRTKQESAPGLVHTLIGKTIQKDYVNHVTIRIRNKLVILRAQSKAHRKISYLTTNLLNFKMLA